MSTYTFTGLNGEDRNKEFTFTEDELDKYKVDIYLDNTLKFPGCIPLGKLLFTETLKLRDIVDGREVKDVTFIKNN